MAVLTKGWQRFAPGECLGWQACGPVTQPGEKRRLDDLLFCVRMRDGRQTYICWSPRKNDGERGIVVRCNGWRDSGNHSRLQAPQRRSNAVTPTLVAELIRRCKGI